MILFFHFICLLARYIASNISKSLSKGKLFWGDETPDNLENQGSDYLKEINGRIKYPIYEGGTLKFFPPVYVQRYETVALILEEAARNSEISKVVDFGCSELGFLLYLKNIEGVTEILEVDIDSKILERYSYKAAPLTTDYLMGKRNKPLDVHILAGSIADYDDHLIGCDAVVGIELIEHLTEEDFEKMPYNVFYRIKPKIVIFTTPNADFNCLFPNFTDLRHEDHKFEWTRKEFYNWTQKILKCFPEYSVKFYGIGTGPEGTENLGCCTQMAVFKRPVDTEFFENTKEISKGIHSYKLVQHYKYPVYTDNRTLEEKIIHEIQYQAAHFSHLDCYYNYETSESEVPLSLLKEFVADLCSDTELLTILKNNGMKLKLKGNSWFLVHSEVDSSDSDTASKNSNWLNDEILETFYEKDDVFFTPRHFQDHNVCFECTTNFESCRNYTQLGLNLAEDSEFWDKEKGECVDTVKEKIKSAPQSYNHLVENPDILGSNKSEYEETKNLNPVKSRIPRMKNERYENSYRRNEKETGVHSICKFKKISKSCSLDSCLENINCKLFEKESYYLNLVLGGSSSTNMGGSLSFEKRRHLKNSSDSSLLSSSLERAGDSGYPFSFSPPEDNLTPEQVDELFTENEIMSRSTSSSSEVDVIDVLNHRVHHDVFIEDIPVENGDLANNNRDWEGNNVEGLMGQRLPQMVNEFQIERDPNDNLFFPDIEEFPPWLLNLGGLAQQPVYFPVDESYNDEGVGDDSGSCCNSSPDLDLDIDF